MAVEADFGVFWVDDDARPTPLTPASPSAANTTSEPSPSLGEAGARRQCDLTRQQKGGGEGDSQKGLRQPHLNAILPNNEQAPIQHPTGEPQ